MQLYSRTQTCQSDRITKGSIKHSDVSGGGRFMPRR